MPTKRKYTPSPETIQDEREARKAGFIRAAEACEVLGILRPNLAKFADKHGIESRKEGREVWYSGHDLLTHLIRLGTDIEARKAMLGEIVRKGHVTETGGRPTKGRSRKR